MFEIEARKKFSYNGSYIILKEECYALVFRNKMFSIKVPSI